MSLMMNRVVVLVVLFGFVICDEKNATVSTTPSTGVNATAVSTSRVVVENKVQNVSIDYRNDHKKSGNASYVVIGAESRNKTTEKPLIITTSKEVRLIQTQKLNDSLAVASNLKGSNYSSFHNEIKPFGRNGPPTTRQPFLPTLKTFTEKTTQKSNNITKTTTQKPAVTTKTTNIVSSPKNLTTKPNNATTLYGKTSPKTNKPRLEYVVEKMAVNEMSSMTMAKDNKRFDFFIVADADNEENKTVASKSSQMFEMKFPNKKSKAKLGSGTQTDFKPIHGDRHKVNPRTQFYQHSTINPISYVSPIPTIYTVRPRYFNMSTTTVPSTTHNKINGSFEKLKNSVKKETTQQDFSCLRCVPKDKNKPYKYSSYPTKKDPIDPTRAVKLQGPDGDSILGGSKSHVVIARPEENRVQKPRTPFSTLTQRGQRNPYFGSESKGSFSTINYNPEPLVRPKKQYDSRDLYNLDEELQSSGSSVSTSKSHVMYEHHEVHIPYPVRVEKRVSYPIHIKVDRPVPVTIDKPYPVHIEKKVPVPVKVPVPQPYPVEREVPYPVKIPIDVPRPVEVAKPVPYIVENPVPVQVINHVKFPVKVPVDVPVPYKVPVRVEKRVPYFIEKKVPFEVSVPVEKPYFVEVKKPFEVPVEKPEPQTIEKKIPVPVQVVEFVKVPIPVKIPVESHYFAYQQRSDVKQDPTPSPENPSNSGAPAQSIKVPLPDMISIEFPHPVALKSVPSSQT